MTLGGIDVLVVLTICLVGAGYKISKLKSPIATTTHSPEKLNLISWKCGSETSLKRFSSLYQEDKELSAGKWEKYDPQSEEKLIVVIHINKRRAYPTNGEENSPEYLVVKKFQEKMGDNLLVLIDVEDAGKFAKTKEPADLISKDTIWGTMFANNRCICTNESNWQERLDAFITK